jgi:CheY-like chemotaxis protein
MAAMTGEATCGGPPRGQSSKSASGHDRLLNGVSILVVEDDPLSAKLAVLLLKQQGADVRVAPNAEQGLKILEEYHPRLVVLDLVLPRMSGLLLAHFIKADERFARTILVAVTMISGPDVERVVSEAGCAAYIRKPIDTDTFAAIVAGCLEKNS